MAILFMDGFDHYAIGDIGTKWTTVNTVAGHSFVTGRSGSGHAIQLNDTNDYLIHQLTSAETSVVMGTGFYSTNIANSPNVFVLLQNPNVQVFLYVGANGSLNIIPAGGTIPAGGSSSPGLIVNNIWYYIEWKITIGTSISANTCQVNLNGIQVINVNSGESVSAGAANIDSFLIRGCDYYSSNNYFDDLYFCNQSGGINNTFLGDCQVLALYPNGNGDTNDFTNSDGNSTNNYTYVDETYEDADTTYVHDATIGDIDLYTYASLPTGVVNVYGVQQLMFARNDDVGGSKSAAAIVKTGGTVYTGATKSLSNTYTYYKQVLDENPNTSVAWTTSDINSIQFGIQVIS